MSSWESQVIDRLASLRSAGHTFDGAWHLALRMYPPRGRDASLATPRLFDEDNKPPPDTYLEFFKRACRDAYEGEVGPAGSGNGPGLRYFSAEMLRDLDSSTPASGRVRQAA